MKRKIVLVLGGLLLLLCGATAGVVAGAAGMFAIANNGDLEAEYYRGLYDVCVKQTQRPEVCLAATAEFRERGWFEQESPGWAWPLPAQGSGA